MSQNVYESLASFLDKLPGGFPSTRSGVELQILRHLFTPGEAELALHLSLIEETAQVIAMRAKRSLQETAGLLEQMERKGLIYARHREGKPPVYMATQFVVGIYEFQLNKLDKELATLLEEYIPHFFQPEIWQQAPQLRTIPVAESLTPEIRIMPYERAQELVKGQTRYSVAPCICRQEKEIFGAPCDKPMETCLSFGSGADFYVRNRMGRYISEDEALEILSLAEQAGLVLQPSASKEAAFICCCCGCCCGVLTNLKRHPKPAEIAHSPFQAVLDQDLCDGCALCLDCCQMEALFAEDGVVHLDRTRCVGCGLCVGACPNEALSLLRKPTGEQRGLPKTWAQAIVRLAKVRGVLSNRKMAELFARSRADRALAARLD